MTLMQWVWMFWHDLAAPVMVGVLTGLILGWWRSRKQPPGRHCRHNGSMRSNRAAGATLRPFSLAIWLPVEI